MLNVLICVSEEDLLPATTAPIILHVSENCMMMGSRSKIKEHARKGCTDESLGDCWIQDLLLSVQLLFSSHVAENVKLVTSTGTENQKNRVLMKDLRSTSKSV